MPTTQRFGWSTINVSCFAILCHFFEWQPFLSERLFGVEVLTHSVICERVDQVNGWFGPLGNLFLASMTPKPIVPKGPKASGQAVWERLHYILKGSLCLQCFQCKRPPSLEDTHHFGTRLFRAEKQKRSGAIGAQRLETPSEAFLVRRPGADPCSHTGTLGFCATRGGLLRLQETG